ncbi:MAG TPA: putative lipid II flippase FtsW [Miltoncostaea sp.]|nr:putative lipid II flippase FtsW [Miltoncostaea sp.]
MAAPRPAPPRARAPRAHASGPAGRPENLLTATVLALVCFGLVMVFSTSSATALLNDGDPLGLAIRQGAYALVGFGAYAVMVRMPAGSIRRLGRPALAIAGFLLLVVLVPSIGMTVNGSRRWISLGGLGQLQPSELAKVALALWLAGYVAATAGRLRTPGGLAPPLVVTGVLGLLILIEPDMGTATSLCVVALAMLIVAGARMRHIGTVVGTLLMLATIAMLAEPYRRERFFTFLDPWADPNGAGFQSVQAQVAIGTGGLHGVGLGDGVQKAFYLPEAHTDMILATVGEELGLVGVVGVLVGFALFALAGYRIAIGARDVHDQALAAGITTLVVMQAFINVGAVVGVLPVTGVPLPFVSFGGSSLIVLLAASGLLVNIGRRSQRRAAPALRPVRQGDDRGRRDGRPRDAGAGGRRRAAGAGG